MELHKHEFIGGACIVEGCGVFLLWEVGTEFDELGRPIG